MIRRSLAGNAGVMALGRLKVGAMNRTEAAYGQMLEGLKATGDVVWYRFEGLKLRLADNTFYTPDWAVMRSTGAIECHEVKGYWTDDARVKIKVAAEMYPFRFVSAKKLPSKAGAEWLLEEFSE